MLGFGSAFGSSWGHSNGMTHKYNKKKIMCDQNAPAASELVDGQVAELTSEAASSSTSRQKPDGPLAADRKIFEGSADCSPAESACDAH